MGQGATLTLSAAATATSSGDTAPTCGQIPSGWSAAPAEGGSMFQSSKCSSGSPRTTLGGKGPGRRHRTCAPGAGRDQGAAEPASPMQ